MLGSCRFHPVHSIRFIRLANVADASFRHVILMSISVVRLLVSALAAA